MTLDKTRWASLILIGFSFSSLLHAQIRSATITGTVKDETGAVVPNAQVAVTNQDTGITDNAATTSAGQFTMPYLPAGTYSVAVTVAGFVPYREKGIALATAQTVRFDVNLKVGAVEQAIEVQAQAAQIQTDSTSVQGATQANVIAAIPNVAQNPIYYALLQAGVQPRNATADTTGINSFGIGINGRRQWSAFGINGGRIFTNDIQLDGITVMGGGYNEAAVVPNTEGLQEVRVISNNFSAEYGRGQGVISMSTKSGTNRYHGTATYRLRNEALNANSNSNNANNLARVPFKVNEFGGALGGPIRKDKLFFSSSYHFLRFNRGVSSLATVPTALEQKGDFSKTSIRDQSGAAIAAQVFDPFSVTTLGPDLFQRTPFPGAVLSSPDKYAQYMYTFYPAPNRTPDDAFQTNNFSSSSVQTVRRHSLNNRVDYRIGQHSIYGSGGIAYGKILTPRPFGKSPFNGAPSETSDKNPYGQIGDTIVLSPTLVLDVRYGMTRINTITFAGDKTGFTDYDAFGVPKNVQAILPIYGAAPVVNPNAFAGGSGGGSNWTALSTGSFGNKHERQMMHVLTGSITKTRGKWTHKAGVDIRNVLSNYDDLEEASAQIPPTSVQVTSNFTFQYVTANGAVASQNASMAQRGVNGAALLVGAGPWWVRAGANVRLALSQRYSAVYTQNDWRATSKLTVNLGLRWDLQPGPTERHDRISAFDLTKNNPFGTKGSLAFPGVGGYDRHLWNTRYKDFGPRVGAAYQATGSLVLRGGFGITYLPSNTGYLSSSVDYGATPFDTGTNVLPYGLSPHGVPVQRFSDAPALIPIVGANPAAPQAYSQSEAKFNRYLQNGRAMQWNFFVEKAFSHSWMVSVGYSASHSDHLINRLQPFQGVQNIGAATLTGWRDQYIASNGTLNPAFQQVPNPFQPSSGALLPFIGPLGSATIARYATLLPYPHLFTSDNTTTATGSRLSWLNDSTGFASYHSLQLHVGHAMSHGLQLDAHYTWSKDLDYTTSVEDSQGFNSGGTAAAPDILNAANNRKYAFSDMPHRFVGTAVYDLPFGAGKRFASSNRILRNIVGSWQTGSVITLQSGMPFSLTGASDGAIVARPNRVTGAPVEVPKELQRWYDGTTSVTLPCGRVVIPSRNTFLKYNSCAFVGQVVRTPNGAVVPDQFWVGNSAQTYGDLRGPGRFNVDLSLRRKFAIREGMTLDLVADASNLLNNTQYNGNYNGALGSTNLQTNQAKGLVPGLGASDTFGTLTVATFDPRQITLHVQLRF